ncbi:hypothetical protein GJ496_008434 [Pomphorhynchus laevis]|nr:hypothetical protein GJ496_008434 [Pomphorhynchus laevis]
MNYKLPKILLKAQYTTCRSSIRVRCLAMQSSLSINNMNPALKNVEYAVRGPILIRANEIQEELNKGNKSFPFSKVIKANIGDCHATGGRYITFIRQVLSMCTYPQLEHKTSSIPPDVVARAKKILQNCGPGKSLGSYSESAGIACLRHDVAAYISKRDGIPADYKNVMASCGASDGIRAILKLVIASPEEKLRSGVMVPIPQYPLYSAALSEYNMDKIGYFLDESKGWGISMDELIRAFEEAKTKCTPRAIVVINPGNPTGQLINEQNIHEVIRFAKDRNLIVLADEVYQDNIYDSNQPFVSFRKVLLTMPAPYNKTELASFHSASKGFMGECGARGGYMEINNFDEKVVFQLLKLLSTNLCPPVWGQAVMDLVISPPEKGDPSYELYFKERSQNLKDLKTKAELVSRLLNEIDGISCNPIKGAMYAFPRIDLPKKFVEMCKKDNVHPDASYCLRLLEETGICVVPGSGFGQKDGTYHFRMTILPSLSEIETLLLKLKNFHEKLIKDFK